MPPLSRLSRSSSCDVTVTIEIEPVRAVTKALFVDQLRAVSSASYLSPTLMFRRIPALGDKYSPVQVTIQVQIHNLVVLWGPGRIILPSVAYSGCIRSLVAVKQRLHMCPCRICSSDQTEWSNGLARVVGSMRAAGPVLTSASMLGNVRSLTFTLSK